MVWNLGEARHSQAFELTTTASLRDRTRNTHEVSPE